MIKKTETLKPVDTTPDKLTFFLSTILTVLMSVSFTFMLASTYELSINVPTFTINIFLLAAGATAVNCTKKKRWGYILMASAPVIAIMLLFMDFGDVYSGFDHFMAVLREYSFRDLDSSYRRSTTGRNAIGTLMIVLNIFPISVLTWTITRRKNIIFAILCYAPFFACSVALNYMFPGQTWCVLAFACVIVLVIFQNTRKVDRKSAEKRIALMMIPALILTVGVGIVFPQDTYDKEEMAKERLAQLRRTFQIKTIPDPVSDTVQHVVQEAQKTYMGSIIVDNLANQALIASLEEEDLSLVGNFNPPVFRILTLRRLQNPDYDGPKYSGSYMYLKTTSMDEYTGQKMLVSHTEPGSDHVFNSRDAIMPEDAQFVVQITPKQMTKVNFIPYYTDYYTADFAQGYIPNTIEVSYDLNTLLKAPEIAQSSYAYAHSAVPVDYQNNWADDYLNYVYSTNLEVPEETKDALLESGLLPQWYIDLVNGDSQMNDYEKVRAVTDWVRSLHPYDANTGFKTTDDDFVLWFIRDCKTGFCVHYAVTSVVLLRMVDVPTRYVSGYMASSVSNSQTADVYSSDAHAWIEFFTLDYGWVMEDPTPGNQLAASGFNYEAVVRAHNPDIAANTPTPIPTQPSGSSTDPSETPEPFYSPTSTPSPKPVETDDDGDTPPVFLKTAMGRVTVFFVALLVLYAIVRLSYVMYWKRSFKKGSVNDQARAYYRYTNLIMTLLAARPTRKIGVIAQKAAFSEEGITEQEFAALIMMCRRNVDTVISKHKRIYAILLSLTAKVKI